MAKYKVKSLSVVIGGKKWELGEVLDTDKLPRLKSEMAEASDAGYLEEVEASTAEKKAAEKKK